MSASELIFAAIRNSGNRVTEPRRLVIAELEASAQPLTIQQLVAQVSVDEVSVYRTIALLRSLHLVEEITDGRGARRFALVSDHHHHLVCERCGYVAHVPCERKKPLPAPTHPDFSSLRAHEVTYYGLCRTCSTQR